MLPFTFGDEPYEKGQSVSSQCSVSSGDLPIRITWLFNNEPLKYPDVAVSSIGRRASAISIDQVSWEHVGNYTCIGENRAGGASYTAELFVNGIGYELINFCLLFFYVVCISNLTFIFLSFFVTFLIPFLVLVSVSSSYKFSIILLVAFNSLRDRKHFHYFEY